MEVSGRTRRIIASRCDRRRDRELIFLGRPMVSMRSFIIRWRQTVLILVPLKIIRRWKLSVRNIRKSTRRFRRMQRRLVLVIRRSRRTLFSFRRLRRLIIETTRKLSWSIGRNFTVWRRTTTKIVYGPLMQLT